MQRGGKLTRGATGVLAGHGREFLDEERITAGAVSQCGAHLWVRVGQQRGEQLVGVGCVQWIEMDVDDVVTAGWRRPVVGELAAGGGEQDHRHATDSLQQPGEEVEQFGISPVEVREDEHQRPLICERGHEREHCTQ